MLRQKSCDCLIVVTLVPNQSSLMWPDLASYPGGGREGGVGRNTWVRGYGQTLLSVRERVWCTAIEHFVLA